MRTHNERAIPIEPDFKLTIFFEKMLFLIWDKSDRSADINEKYS